MEIVETVIRTLFELLGGPFAQTDLLRALLIPVVLLYASYQDWKTRLISDRVWIPLYVGGLVLLIYDLLNGVWYVLAPSILLNMIVATVTAVALYKLRIFYGADMKAIIGLGVAFPTYPLLGDYPLVSPESVGAGQVEVTGVFILAILANSAVFGLLFPVKSFIKNIRNGAYKDGNLLWLFVAEQRDIKSLTVNDHGNIIDTWSTDYSANPILKGLQLMKSGINGVDVRFIPDYVSWRREFEESSEKDAATQTEETAENSQVEDEKDSVQQDSQGATPVEEDESPSFTSLRDLQSEAIHTYLSEFVDQSEMWHVPDPESQTESLRELAENDTVWVTPGIPYIIPILLGVVSASFAGNLMYLLILTV